MSQSPTIKHRSQNNVWFGTNTLRLVIEAELNRGAYWYKQTLLAKRIEQLTERLMQGQKRTGGERASRVCQTQATILARQETGESLKAIASDLEMPYETVKTYVKRARYTLKFEQSLELD